MGLARLISDFMNGWQDESAKIVQEEKELRDNMSERKIDKMVNDSFPASDPPSTY